LSCAQHYFLLGKNSSTVSPTLLTFVHIFSHCYNRAPCIPTSAFLILGKGEERQRDVSGDAEPLHAKREVNEHQVVERQDSRHNAQSGSKHRLVKTNSGQQSDKLAEKRGTGVMTSVAPVSASNNNQRPGKRTERPKSPQVGQK